MKNTDSNSMLLNNLNIMCDGTPYDMRIREHGNYITPYLFTRTDAPKYTPAFYLDEDIDGYFRISVQTTSYGALKPERIMEVASGLMVAANLAKAMSSVLTCAGFKVIFG